MQAEDPSSVNITYVAMKNGFMQMGYFCGEYKKNIWGDTLRNTSTMTIAEQENQNPEEMQSAPFCAA